MSDVFDRLKAALADRYAIEREIGAGGMATVYLAEDLKHHRNVAVKVLRPDLAAALGPERFLQEIEIAAQLQHPHILPLHDSGEADGFLFYVMPFVEGLSLREKLAKEGELPIGDAVRILRDVVDALTEAHEQGVVHRDIKPENIMLRGRHALVTDFGVAKAISEATGREKLTTVGVALGTPAYMAPEQAAADPNIDHRVDIYAVGAVAYELLTGRPVFRGTTPQMVLSAHMTEPAQPVTKHRDTVPAALEALVMRCLEKRPADRWQSADDLLPQLEALATPSGGVTPTQTQPMKPDKPHRERLSALIGVLLAIVVVTVGVVLLLRESGGSDLDPLRVVVAPLENRTDEAANAEWGDMAAEWINRGISRSEALTVAPMTTVRRYWAEVAIGESQPIRELAEHVDAATVVSGQYRILGTSVQFQAEILDAASGDLRISLDPVSGPTDSIESVIGTLAERVVAAVAAQLDPDMPSWGRNYSTPPTMEVFRTWLRAGDLHSESKWQEAVDEAERVLTMDSTWPPAITLAGVTNYNNGNIARAESLYTAANQLRDRLTPSERADVDWMLLGWIGGDLEAELRAAREMARTDPTGGAYPHGLTASRNNRPVEALESLSQADTSEAWLNRWIQYWYVYTGAAHWAADYRLELAIAREARSRFPNRLAALFREVRARIALGHLEEVQQLLSDARSYPPPGTPGIYLRMAAEELRAHDYIAESEEMFAESIAWFLQRLVELPDDAGLKSGLALAVYSAGHWEEADSLYQLLREEDRDDLTYLGRHGVVVARLGNRDAALEIHDQIAAIDRPYDRGRTTRWRAGIMAALGDRARALDLLIQSVNEGRLCCAALHTDIAFENISDYAPFQEFIRPKG